VLRGVKKLFSLARTKNRLAAEADTVKTIPAPLSLVKYLSGVELKTVDECVSYRDRLREEISWDDPECIASTVLQLMDVIEGVKYKFEPPEFMSSINHKRFIMLEDKIAETSSSVNLLIMTKTAPEGFNLYVGSNPPRGCVFLSAVPTSLAVYLDYAFKSDYFSREGKLKHINSVLGNKTLINNAIHYALGVYGAILHDEGSLLPAD